MEESRGEHADLGWALVSNQIDLAIPSEALDDGHGTDWPVDGVGGGDVVSVGRPGAAAEVRRQGRALERRADGRLQDKIVNHVMLGRSRRRRGVSKDLDGSVVAGRREELSSRVEGDSFDVALVHGERLKLLKGMARPNNDLGI